MNKKIKVFDLIEMFYRKEKMPKRIKVSCYEFEYDEEINAYFNLDKNSNNNSLIQDWLNNASKLNNEVEILEDNTEEIEELDRNLKFDDLITPYGKNEDMMWTEIIKQHNKINELVKAVKEIRKDLNK